MDKSTRLENSILGCKLRSSFRHQNKMGSQFRLLRDAWHKRRYDDGKKWEDV
jgi:hypothetical protein